MPCVDGKTLVQAPARSQPAFPMMRGRPERCTHDCIRRGEPVRGVQHRRHRAVEFEKFRTKISSRVPDGPQVHLIVDNYATHTSPTTTKWLAGHPRFHLHEATSADGSKPVTTTVGRCGHVTAPAHEMPSWGPISS